MPPVFRKIFRSGVYAPHVIENVRMRVFREHFARGALNIERFPFAPIVMEQHRIGDILKAQMLQKLHAAHVVRHDDVTVR